MVSAMEVCGMKPLAPVARAVVNPAYIAAQYEDVMIFSDKAAHWKMRPANPSERTDVPARRYNFEDGEWVQVPYYTTEYS